MQQACDAYVAKNGQVNTTNCVVSSGYKLSELNGINKIIHAVGPRWDKNNEDECKEQLVKTYATIFAMGENQKLKNIALPLISSKIFGFPSDIACECAQQGLQQYINNKLS